MPFMAFAVVKFVVTDVVSVVPVNWIRGSKCLWPPKSLQAKIAPLIEKNISPSEAWEEFTIETLGIFPNYQEARLKLPKAQVQSDLNSTDNENRGKGRRIKFKRKLSTSSTDSETSEQNSFDLLESPPVLDLLDESPLAHSTPKDAPKICSKKNSVHLVKVSDNHPLNAEPSCSLTFTTEDLVYAAKRSGPLLNKSSQAGSTIDSSSNNLAFQRTILREIQIIKSNQKYIMEALDSKLFSESAKSSSSMSPKDDLCHLIEDLIKLLPITSESNLSTVNERLNDENSFNQMILYLSRIGGINVDQGLKFMLKKLMNDDIAMTFSLQGLRGKNSFKLSNLYRVIMGTIRNHDSWKETTENDIDRVIGNWLRHAKGRIVRNHYSWNKAMEKDIVISD